MNLGERITDQPLLENIPEGSSYLMEAGDGSGTKQVKHETVVSEMKKDLQIGDMEELEELEKLDVPENQEGEKDQEKQGKNEKFTIMKAILKVFRIATTVFKGTDGIKAGTAGLVPLPEPEDEGKVLGAGGTWVEPQNGNSRVPVGHILAYMGTTAPNDYLKCDGQVYDIADYPILAQHFKNEFGEEKYFGSDGESTFAVPDLRGEFLRGSGAATRNTGSGAAVGVHQDGTEHLYIQVGSQGNRIFGAYEKLSSIGRDKDTYTDSKRWSIDANPTTGQYINTYTSRPTNTSVLWCIKYQ